MAPGYPQRIAALVLRPSLYVVHEMHPGGEILAPAGDSEANLAAVIDDTDAGNKGALYLGSLVGYP